MIHTCELCGSDFLTEADPYVVRPTPTGVKLYCVCQIKGFDEMKGAEKLKEENKKLVEALKFYANSLNYSAIVDYKGLHYVSVIGEKHELGEDNGRLARQVLKEIGEE